MGEEIRIKEEERARILKGPSVQERAQVVRDNMIQAANKLSVGQTAHGPQANPKVKNLVGDTLKHGTINFCSECGTKSTEG